MSSVSKNYMLTAMQRYFAKVREAISTGGASAFRYTTGSVPANGQVVYDAPTQLSFDVTLYQPYSLGVELRMTDPFTTTNPQVVEATAVLTYAIQTDGKLVIKNNHSSAVTYYARVTMPVRK